MINSEMELFKNELHALIKNEINISVENEIEDLRQDCIHSYSIFDSQIHDLYVLVEALNIKIEQLEDQNNNLLAEIAKRNI